MRSTIHVQYIVQSLDSTRVFLYSVWRRMKQNMEELKSFQLGVKLEFKQRVTWAMQTPKSATHSQAWYQ